MLLVTLDQMETQSMVASRWLIIRQKHPKKCFCAMSSLHCVLIGDESSSRLNEIKWVEEATALSRPGASKHMQEEARTEHIGANHIKPSSSMLSPARKLFIDPSASRDDSRAEFSSLTSTIIRLTSEIDSIRYLKSPRRNFKRDSPVSARWPSTDTRRWGDKGLRSFSIGRAAHPTPIPGI